MFFKDLKQNYHVYFLDKHEFEVSEGRVSAVSFPRVEVSQKTGRTEMVVDVTIESKGKTATYTIPENLSVTYAGNLVISTDKQGLVSEVESVVANADHILSSVDRANKIKEKAPAILSDLSPDFKDKQATEQRFTKLESSLSEMKELMKSQQQAISSFISKFES